MPLDRHEAEQGKSAMQTPFWMEYSRRIAAELERAIGACARSDYDLDIRRAQGAAAALRTVQALPQMILTEVANRTA